MSGPLSVMERARVRLDSAADHHAHEGNEAQAKGYVEITNEMIEASAAVAELLNAALDVLADRDYCAGESLNGIIGNKQIRALRAATEKFKEA